MPRVNSYVNYGTFEPNRMSTKHLVRRNGEMARQWIEFAKQQQRVPQVIFDVGANVGVFAISFAMLLPEARIYAFEPVTTTFDVLQRNIKNFGFQRRVAVFNVGFWSSPCSMMLGFPEARRNERANTGLYSVNGPAHQVKCQFDTMDAWAEAQGVWPDFIKIDAEGSELAIVMAGSKCLAGASYVTCEMGHGNDTPVEKILRCKFKKIDELSKRDTFWARKDL